MYFRNSSLRKTSLDQCLKSTISKYHLTVNMFTAVLSYCFIPLTETDLENVSLSDMGNLRQLC